VSTESTSLTDDLFVPGGWLAAEHQLAQAEKAAFHIVIASLAPSPRRHRGLELEAALRRPHQGARPQ